jgi:hypothetical protein
MTMMTVWSNWLTLHLHKTFWYDPMVLCQSAGGIQWQFNRYWCEAHILFSTILHKPRAAFAGTAHPCFR